MKTVEIQLFKFDELTENAKQKAINKYRDSGINYYWYSFINEDAKDVGIKIKSFDISRKEIEIDLLYSYDEVASKIISNHGEYCDSYIKAKCFLDDKDALVEKYSNGINLSIVSEEKFDEEFDDLEQDFKNDLEDYYLKMLRDELEYMESDGYIIQMIIDNDYDFTEDGEMY